MSLKDIAKDAANQFVDTAIKKTLNSAFGDRAGLPQEGFNVNRMVSSLNRSGVASTSHFEAYIHTGLGVGTMQDERDISLRIDSIDLPGRSFSPIDHKFTNIGPVNKLPGQQTYSDITATIILSEDMREKEYFEWWQDNMVNTGAYESAESGSTGRLSGSKFDYKYFDNYVGRVVIRQFGSQGELKSIHTLNEAYPLSIAPVGMNWSTEDVARLSVTFGYRNYSVVFNRQDQPGLGSGFTFHYGKGGFKLGARLPGIGNFAYNKGSGITGSVSQQVVNSAVNGTFKAITDITRNIISSNPVTYNGNRNAINTTTNSATGGVNFLHVGGRNVTQVVGLPNLRNAGGLQPIGAGGGISTTTIT